MKKNIPLMLAASILSLTITPQASHAETVTTQTIVTNKPVPGVNVVDFASFDINNDGAFSMPEVGERLFQSFDKDENGHIDNMEWDNKSVITISPMEKETFKYIDYDNDGYTDETVYTYQTFYQASGLIRFDDNQDGLSAKEFVGGQTILELDKDGDNLISLAEWKDAYIISLKPKAVEPERYNH